VGGCDGEDREKNSGRAKTSRKHAYNKFVQEGGPLLRPASVGKRYKKPRVGITREKRKDAGNPQQGKDGIENELDAIHKHLKGASADMAEKERGHSTERKWDPCLKEERGQRSKDIS